MAIDPSSRKLVKTLRYDLRERRRLANYYWGPPSRRTRSKTAAQAAASAAQAAAAAGQQPAPAPPKDPGPRTGTLAPPRPLPARKQLALATRPLTKRQALFNKQSGPRWEQEHKKQGVPFKANPWRVAQLGGVLGDITALPPTAPMPMLGKKLRRGPVGRGSGLRREVFVEMEVMDPVCVGIVEGVWRGVRGG